jgi:hypothetical protein
MNEKHLYGQPPSNAPDDYYGRRGDRQDHEIGAFVAIVASVLAVIGVMLAAAWDWVRR